MRKILFTTALFTLLPIALVGKGKAAREAAARRARKNEQILEEAREKKRERLQAQQQPNGDNRVNRVREEKINRLAQVSKQKYG